ncbi:MAG: succinylglutamate desuccinylase/aspartoacylase family protein [Gammaproteobacteria bacterium]
MSPAGLQRPLRCVLLLGALGTTGAEATETPALAPAAGIETITAPTDEAAPAAAADAGAGATASAAPTWPAIDILGASVAPGSRAELRWTAGQSFAGRAIDTPVIVLRGAKPGPSLCLTAAIHGDELNGVEIVRRLLAGTDPKDLRGMLIGAPIVNLLGFSSGSRYLPDRRDLNRYFPGDASGSLASRIAHVFFSQVMTHCDRLVDLHTGSFKRSNLPQLRADLTSAAVREFAARFGATAVLHKFGARGTLREAAVAAGIPAVAFELGEPGTLQLEHVEHGVEAIENLLYQLDMIDRFRLFAASQPIYYRSHWLRAYRGGILTSELGLGERVARGDVLGIVTNPLTNERSEILSPYDGRVLGRALDQFVLPGFATFHIGIEADDATGLTAATPAAAYPSAADERPVDWRGGEGAELRSLDDSVPDSIDDELH